MPKRQAAPLHPPRPKRPSAAAQQVSPLVLCDQLIQVAQDADRAGYPSTAAGLVALVDRMFDAPPARL